MLKPRFSLSVVLLLLVPIVGQTQTAEIPTAKNQAVKPDPETVRINALIEQSQLAVKGRDWRKVEEIAKQLIAERHEDWDFYQLLGDAQLNLGEYNDSIKSYEQAFELASKAVEAPANSEKTKARTAAMSTMLTNEGNAYLKLRKNEDAIRMFMRAAEISPNPGVAYFNICATAYNTGNIDGAASACRKAIQADPKKADAYFVLGSCLFSDSHMDKNNRLVAPPEALNALNKYLELAPDGPHAKDVKDMLEAAGQKK